jgi:hypothetical protein
MNRRELLAGAAMLAGAGQANAFGIGKLGARGGMGSLGNLGGASSPPLAYPQNYAEIGDSIPWAQSGVANNSICQIGQWINGFSAGRIKLVQGFNQGVGGQTSTTIAARYTSSLTSLNAKIVLANGGINDLGADVAATTILTAWDSMISQAAALGHYLIVLPPMPTLQLTGPQETQRQLVVAGLNARASSTVRVIDITGYNYTTMDYAQQVGGNRIHPNIVGAQWLGAKGAAIVATIVKPATGLGTGLLAATDPLNKATNGYMSGTGGALAGIATGSLADSWTAAATTQGNVTMALSKVARAAGGSWQQVQIGGTFIPSTNSVSLQLNGNTLTGFAANDMVVMMMDMQVDAGAVNVDGISVSGLLFETGFASNFFTQVYYVNTTEHQGGYGTPVSNYIVQSEPFNLAAGKVPGTLNIFVTPNLNQDAGSGAACAITFRLGSVGIKKYT